MFHGTAHTTLCLVYFKLKFKEINLFDQKIDFLFPLLFKIFEKNMQIMKSNRSHSSYQHGRCILTQWQHGVNDYIC